MMMASSDIVARSLEISFIFFLSCSALLSLFRLLGRIGYVCVSFIHLCRSLCPQNRIHFDSFVLLLDLLFSIDSFSMLFFFLFFRCWTVFLFISLSLHPERPCCTCAPITSLFMAHINITQQHWYACTALHYSRNMDSSNIHVPKWVLNRCIIFECWLFCGSSMKIKFLWKILFVEIRVKSNKMRQEMNGKIIRVKQRQLAVIRFRRKNNNGWKQNKSVVQTFRRPFLQLIIFGIHFYSRRSLSWMPDSVNFVLIFPRAYNFFLIQCKYIFFSNWWFVWYFLFPSFEMASEKRKYFSTFFLFISFPFPLKCYECENGSKSANSAL